MIIVTDKLVTPPYSVLNFHINMGPGVTFTDVCKSVLCMTIFMY